MTDNADTPVPPDTRKIDDDARAIAPVFGLGRFAPFAWEQSADKTIVRLFWGRIALWLLSVSILGWTALATGAYAFVKYRRGFPEVRYTHMLLLPWKLDDYRRAKGEFMIKQGLALAENQEWRAAFTPLRRGLLSVPEHREARLMVARLYLMAGRTDVVRTTLLDGLPHHGDQLDYLREVLGFFFRLQADDTVITLAQELRGRLEPSAPAYRMATTALAYAFFNRNRYQEAESLLRDSNLMGSPEGRFVMARILWERNQREEALARLRNLTVAVPDDHEIYRTLVAYLKEEARWGEIRRVSVTRQLTRPERPEAYVDFIAACSEENDQAGQTEAEDAFFRRFSNDLPSLLKLADEAASRGRVESVERVLARCQAMKRNESDATLLLAFAHLERRNHEAVLSLAYQIKADSSQWSRQQSMLFAGVHAAALYGLRRDAEAETLIHQICDSRLLSAQVLTLLASHMEKVGKKTESVRLLRHAFEIDPLSQPALVELLRDAQEKNDLGGSLPMIDRLLDMRKPPVALLTTLEADLGSDRYLFLPGQERTQKAINAWLAAREL